MDVLDKLTILTDAAKYDAACTSSGSRRGFPEGLHRQYVLCPGRLLPQLLRGWALRHAAEGADEQLLHLRLQILRQPPQQRHTARAAFTPEELADLTISFYRRNYIEGLFLSSGVLPQPGLHHGADDPRHPASCGRTYRFNGYIHAKAIPGAAPELVEQLGLLADRLSVQH